MKQVTIVETPNYALEHDPDYLEDKEWSEVEEIGRRLEKNDWLTI